MSGRFSLSALGITIDTIIFTEPPSTASFPLPPAAVSVDFRPDVLRYRHGADIILPDWHNLLHRRLPRTVHPLFAQTDRTDGIGRHVIGVVRETPQEYATVHTRAHHKPSGLTFALVTTPACPVPMCVGIASLYSHTFTIWSELPVTMYFPVNMPRPVE